MKTGGVSGGRLQGRPRVERSATPVTHHQEVVSSARLPVPSPSLLYPSPGDALPAQQLLNFFFFATVRNRFEVEQHTIHVINKYV